MITQINDFQLDIVTGLANTKTRSYGMPSSIETDPDKLQIDRDNIFVDELEDWGLLKLADSKSVGEGRILRVFTLTKAGQAMFRRTKWQRRVN
jgi:hypothetical protein